jgi:NAD(P)H-flavin reductase
MPQTATVAHTAMVSPRDKLIGLSITNRKFEYLPGQFVMLSVPGIGEAPFSLASLPQKNGSFETIIRNVGKVTSALHALAAGDTLGMRGPFGTHFPLEESFGKNIVLLGSDIGLSPLRSAIGFVLENRDRFGKVFLFCGRGGDLHRLVARDIESRKTGDLVDFCQVDFSDDAEMSSHLSALKNSIDPCDAAAFCAGPENLRTHAIRTLQSLGLRDTNIFLSLERRMKCGVGKCGHCQIDGVHVCLDGPVFSSKRFTALGGALA